MSDSLNIIESIKTFPDQCAQVINEIATQQIPHDCYLVNNVVISGMGGSALGGRVLAAIERESLRVPIVISTEYGLPNFVNDKSLVIISSYSGNTAETVHSLHEALARNAKVFVLATGGKLADLMEEHNLPGYIFNPVHNISSMPRMALGYNILSLITLLSRCQLINPAENLAELPGFLKSLQGRHEEIHQLAVKLSGRIPVFISSEHLKGAVHALRNQLHENSKTFSVAFDLPEANHHLLEGLRFPRTNPDILAFVFFHSRLYSPQLLATYPLTQSVIEKNHIPVFTHEVSGPSRLFESIGLVQTGAYLAYELSQVYDIDPGPIPYVDWFKDEMRKTH